MRTNSNGFFVKTFFTAILFFVCFTVCGQYTYLNANLGYSATSLTNSDILTNRVRNLSLNIGAVQRVLKPLGIGAEINIPLLQPGEKNYVNADVDANGFFSGWEDARGNFAPDEFSYQVGFKTVTRLLIRIYLGDNTDEFYFELRYAFGGLSESYLFERSGFFEERAYPGVSLNYDSDRSFRAPGLAVGYQSTSSNRFFFNTRIGFDFANFESGGFDYTIPVRASGSFSNGLITNESLIPDSGTIWFYDIGFGYFF